MDLQAVEVELLVKACQKYRSTLPGYLLSAREDLALADALLAKLREIHREDEADA